MLAVSSSASTTAIELTEREEMVVGLLLEGRLQKQIAYQLDVSQGTVASYVGAVAERLPGDGRPSLKIVRFFSVHPRSA